jgi:hypothetical protein
MSQYIHIMGNEIQAPVLHIVTPCTRNNLKTLYNHRQADLTGKGTKSPLRIRNTEAPTNSFLKLYCLPLDHRTAYCSVPQLSGTHRSGARTNEIGERENIWNCSITVITSDEKS